MPEPISILKPGTFHAMSGEQVTFTADDLKSAVASYDPALHEAPIVVGHPKTDDPAYGWIKSLRVDGGQLVAEPHQVDEGFAELVNSGRFKKVSPSFYRPDAPNNPAPGKWYLRHVGFLGAQPPAVKGLKQVALADTEAGIVELADGWMISDIAGMFRSLRDWILGERGQEAADKAIPGSSIDYLLQRAGQEQQKDMATNSFAEPRTKETDVTTAEQQAADLKAAQDKVAADQVQLAERERAIKDREAQVRRQDIGRFIDTLVTDGKLPPAQKDGLVAFMAALPGDEVVEFGEGSAKVKQSPDKFLRDFLSKLGKVIEFSEIAGGDRKTPTDDPIALAEQIREEQDKAEKAGRPISTADALERVKKA